MKGFAWLEISSSFLMVVLNIDGHLISQKSPNAMCVLFPDIFTNYPHKFLKYPLGVPPFFTKTYMYTLCYRLDSIYYIT